MSDAAQLSEPKRLLLQKMLAGNPAARMEAAAIAARPPGKTAPISPDQMNVWVHAAMAADAPLYNESVTIRRRGPLDLALLEHSFNELLRRHEILRTTFAEVEGEIVQIVAPTLTVELPLTDLSALPAEEREREAARLAGNDARAVFDLGKLPLFRPRVVRMAADDHRIYLAFHHIVFDGVSLYKAMVPELAAIYDSLEAGVTPCLPKPTLQYGDYALWRHQRVANGALDKELAYWRRQLSGELPVLQLPCDRPRPETLTYSGGMETFVLPRALSEHVKKLALRKGATPYMLLLAVYAILLARYSGQDDIVVGSIADCRQRPELQGMLGYFLNSLALRTHPAPQKPFPAFLEE
ncbi:MAG TPA: condensation domain-containing protein, partial [Stellaceae bacterium]|nr:condensation domain-containing protein [Stellaceae bacterium]